MRDLPKEFVGIEEIDRFGKLKLNNAVLRAEKRSAFIKKVLDHFLDSFDATTFGWNGPQLFTRVYESISTSVTLLESTVFYSVPWDKVHELFENQPLGLSADNVGIHLWQSLIKGQLDHMSEYFLNTRIGELFLFSCPDSYHPLQAAPEARVVSITNPLAGQQFTTSTIPIYVTVHGNPTPNSQLCIELNGESIQCLDMNVSNMSLQNVPTGHHVLRLQLCCLSIPEDSLWVKHSSLALYCAGQSALTSFTVNFHEVST